jgi:hypothetical protein
VSLRAKRGSIVRLECTHTSGGSPVNLTGVTVTCSARRTPGSTPATLDVVVTNAAQGRFSLEADTSGWAAGRWSADVKFAAAGSRYWTETFVLEIVEPITP